MNPGLLPGFGRTRQGARGIVGLLSVPGTTSSGYHSSFYQIARCLTVLSGTNTAGVSQEYLNIMGGGRILMMGAYGNSPVARNVTTVLNVDGSAIVQDTSVLHSGGTGKIYVGTGGYGAGVGPLVVYQSIEFQRSLQLLATSDTSETNGFTLAYNIELWE